MEREDDVVLGHSLHRHGDHDVERSYSCRAFDAVHDQGRGRLGSGTESVARHPLVGPKDNGVLGRLSDHCRDQGVERADKGAR